MDGQVEESPAPPELYVSQRGSDEKSAGKSVEKTGEPGGRRIEVHPDFDTHTFERLVSALERV